MNTQHPTIANGHDPEQTLTDLTLCLSQTYAARGRIHLDRSHLDLALADLDESLRLDPDNAETHRLRGIIERHPGQIPPAPTARGQTERDEPAIDAGLRPHTRFEAGYQVMARYPDNPRRPDDLLVTSFPPTSRGYHEAVEYAKHLCSDKSSSDREKLYDAHLTGGENFDTVVVEFRSLSREVHLEKAALDEIGEPLDERGTDD